MIANLGDSRAVLGTLTEDGGISAVQLTSDLTPDVPSMVFSLSSWLRKDCIIRSFMILINIIRSFMILIE